MQGQPSLLDIAFSILSLGASDRHQAGVDDEHAASFG